MSVFVTPYVAPGEPQQRTAWPTWRFSLQACVSAMCKRQVGIIRIAQRRAMFVMKAVRFCKPDRSDALGSVYLGKWHNDAVTTLHLARIG